MKMQLLNIIEEYLNIFPNEKERQQKLIEYLNTHEDDEITNWNNFDGHITAGGLIYALKEKKHLESLEFTNQHIKTLLKISFGIKIMTPVIFHYIAPNKIIIIVLIIELIKTLSNNINIITIAKVAI